MRSRLFRAADTLHAFDEHGVADQALDAAFRYSSAAPSIPHALHMASHIYNRMGM